MVAANVDFEPLMDYLLCERIKVTETKGGIQLPDSAAQMAGEDCAKARVIKAGPGMRDKEQNLVPMTIKAGDVVYCISRYAPAQIQLGGRDYFVIREAELVGKCTE